MVSFPNLSTPLVKLDLTFEAGSRYQSTPSLAHAANHLLALATHAHNAHYIAEYLDFRGIIIERSADSCSACLSVYLLRRYAVEFIPLLREMIEQPLLPSDNFAAYVNKRRQQLMTNEQKTAVVARNLFYEKLFGSTHPLGVHARPEEVERLTPQLVADFWQRRYPPQHAVLQVSGHIDPPLFDLIGTVFPQTTPCGVPHPQLERPAISDLQTSRLILPQAIQTSVRVGRILPLAWDSPDYFRFLVLNTVLGGYFGSRLMSNLREERGYTYGIYSQTQIFRGCIVFFISADVASGATSDALHQIDVEMERLGSDLISEGELLRVRNFMKGDYIRSIDGVFERSERHRQMVANDIDDRFEQALLDAISHTTPEQLRLLAQRFLLPSEMLHVSVGPSTED